MSMLWCKLVTHDPGQGFPAGLCSPDSHRVSYAENEKIMRTWRWRMSADIILYLPEDQLKTGTPDGRSEFVFGTFVERSLPSTVVQKPMMPITSSLLDTCSAGDIITATAVLSGLRWGTVPVIVLGFVPSTWKAYMLWGDRFLEYCIHPQKSSFQCSGTSQTKPNHFLSFLYSYTDNGKV